MDYNIIFSSKPGSGKGEGDHVIDMCVMYCDHVTTKKNLLHKILLLIHVYYIKSHFLKLKVHLVNKLKLVVT